MYDNKYSYYLQMSESDAHRLEKATRVKPTHRTVGIIHPGKASSLQVPKLLIGNFFCHV